MKSVKPAEKVTVASRGGTLLKEDVVLADPTGISWCVVRERHRKACSGPLLSI